jgi:hypothetical protein
LAIYFRLVGRRLLNGHVGCDWVTASHLKQFHIHILLYNCILVLIKRDGLNARDFSDNINKIASSIHACAHTSFYPSP